VSEPAEPELRAVPDPPDSGTSDRAEPVAGAARPRRERPWLVIGLVIALLIAGLAYLSESARSARLEGQVESLEGELTSANQSLQAYEQRMDVVRSHVGQISAQMAELEQVVAEPE
jgi:hypothetical protein